MHHRITLFVTLALIISTLVGCSGSATIATDRPHDAPPITLETFETRHLVLVEAPTPGWQATITRTHRGLDIDDVFITLRRPDPGVLYPQVIVQQQLLTNVLTTRPVRVYARVLDFSQKSEKPPYRLATEKSNDQ